MAPPVLVLAPGAWHTPHAYHKIIPRLEEKGFTCDTISFPSVFANPPPQDLNADIQAVRNVITPYVDEGRDVVIVVHSWSGAVINSALKGLDKATRLEEGKIGGVSKLIFIAAFLVPEGVSVFDAVGGEVPSLWNTKGDIIYANDPVTTFYNDLDPDEAQYYTSLLKPHAKATKYTKTTGEAWKHIPSVYLICDNDNAIPPFAQKGMVNIAQDEGANMKTERINTSHSPFLSKPDEVSDFIIRHTNES
ncbi:hypothetical protein FDECE_2984 [Fusarium decemcellulare]|nr:hypothetical protein FDECE_2984 [Fusarium decemcellulare]